MSLIPKRRDTSYERELEDENQNWDENWDENQLVESENPWPYDYGLYHGTVGRELADIRAKFAPLRILEVMKITNSEVRKRYENRIESMRFENDEWSESESEEVLYHGTQEEKVRPIMEKGFDERYARDGFFGRGLNFSAEPEKAGEFVFGVRRSGCDTHKQFVCEECDRSKVNMGIRSELIKPTKEDETHAPARIVGHPPIGCNSVVGNVKNFGRVNVVFRGDQVLPTHIVKCRWPPSKRPAKKRRLLAGYNHGALN